MATTDKGLPAVPRGLDRNLTFFLQNLVNVIGRLSGLSPGSETTRAVRVTESVVITATGTIISGTGSRSGISAGSVGSTEVTDASVTTRKLANGAVTSPKIADGAIDETKIANKSITSAKIADGEVTTSKINNEAVTTAKIASGAITKDKIAAGVLSSESVPVDGSVTGAKIASGAITADKLAAGVIPYIPTELPPTDDSVTFYKLAESAILTVTTGEVTATSSSTGTSESTSESETETGKIEYLPFEWRMKPLVAVQNITASTKSGKCGIFNLTEYESGLWRFEAFGSFRWVAIGYIYETSNSYGG